MVRLELEVRQLDLWLDVLAQQLLSDQIPPFEWLQRLVLSAMLIEIEYG